MLQRTATHCNTLQHTATHRNTLQHTATHCNTLLHTATPLISSRSSLVSPPATTVVTVINTDSLIDSINGVMLTVVTCNLLMEPRSGVWGGGGGGGGSGVGGLGHPPPPPFPTLQTHDRSGGSWVEGAEIEESELEKVEFEMVTPRLDVPRDGEEVEMLFENSRAPSATYCNTLQHTEFSCRCAEGWRGG